MKKLKNILKLMNLMSQHYTNSMDEICVPIIKKILGHYLEPNPDYNNGLQRNQQLNGKVHKRKKHSYRKSEEFSKALINAENALRELKKFY